MNADGFVWNGDKIIPRVKLRVNAQLLAIGLDLREQSAAQAPMDTGILRANCSVQAQDGRVQVGYSLSYAMRQHEDLSATHKVGKAKYLEDPFYAGRAGYIEQLGKAVESGCGI